MPEQWPDWLKQRHLQPFRAKQIIDWVYQKQITAPQAMTNLSQRHRDLLADQLQWLTVIDKQIFTAADRTTKLLLTWPDHQHSECVLIPATNPDGKPRNTACISTQVGCAVGCRFCASGIHGLVRNLTAGQIVEQLWHLMQLPGVDRISNVVFMGIGEPLANLEATGRAVTLIHHPKTFNISARKITISTVGLPEAIRQLAAMGIPVTLAISLHAPDDTLRQQLIPWARHHSIRSILDAAQDYFRATGREITIEYILLKNINDSTAHADRLAGLLKGYRANVNLIRFNPVSALPYETPEETTVRTFEHRLTQAGVNTHLRASRGSDIAAACGQLRRQQIDAPD